jgi:flagellar assembly protein FliH
VLIDDSALPSGQNDVIEETVRREITKIRMQAETEGRETGLAEGRQAGQNEAADTLLNATNALREAWSQLAVPLANKEQELAELVTDLAFELARHIIGNEVTASTASLKKLVLQLVQEAATERHTSQTILVRLNPIDYAALNDFSALENLNLLADIKISRGGALLEIFNPDGDASDKITWDATIEARIGSIRAALALDEPPAV